MTDPIPALRAWLLDRDVHLRPPRVILEHHDALCFPEEPLGGIPLQTWDEGDPESRDIGWARFSQVAGSRTFKADYQWGGLVGGAYLLTWNPHHHDFRVERLSVA